LLEEAGMSLEKIQKRNFMADPELAPKKDKTLQTG
jgi:hypothetical protein